MKKYLVIVTSVIGSFRNNYVLPDLTAFFSNVEEAYEYGFNEVVKLSYYPALADYYVYSLDCTVD